MKIRSKNEGKIMGKTRDKNTRKGVGRDRKGKKKMERREINKV